jgi:hypothetical protein
MDGLFDQLAVKAGQRSDVSIRSVDIGDLQNLSFNPHTNRQGNSGANLRAAGTQRLFLFA